MFRSDKWLGRIALACAFTATVGVGTAGCGGGEVSGEVVVVEPAETTGLLTVRWLVVSTTDPFACFDNFAAEIELALYDAGGALWSVEYANCDQFELTLELPTGDWFVDATLVDVDRLPVSTTVPLDVRVEPGSESIIDVNFPSDSML